MLTILVAVALSIPPSFKSINAYRKTPLWVAASSALERGQLRADAMEIHERETLVRVIENAQASEPVAGDRCAVRFNSPMDDAPDMDTPTNFEGVVAYAKSHPVIEGRVSAADVGFYAGIPFTMVRVETADSKTKYLLLPAGAVDVSGAHLCTVDASFPAVPEVDDRVVAVVGQAIDADGTVHRLPGERLFIEHRGRLIVPPRMARDRALFPIENAAQLAAALR